jgi:hypothetical protein
MSSQSSHHAGDQASAGTIQFQVHARDAYKRTHGQGPTPELSYDMNTDCARLSY